MIIHSIVPPQLLAEQPLCQPYSTRRINGGYLEGYNTPQGFKTTRLCATDLSLYLKNEYAPGSIVPFKERSAR